SGARPLPGSLPARVDRSRGNAPLSVGPSGMRLRGGALQKMPQPLALRSQVARVGGIGRDLQRLARRDLHAVVAERFDLPGVVGQESDLAVAQVPEDLRRDAVVPEVRLE